MIATDKDALICDMAETYKVFDLWALPVPMLATLAAGLRDDSRIKIKLSGARAATDTLLLASIADALNFLAWAKTKAAQTGQKPPQIVFERVYGNAANARRSDGLPHAGRL